jgi:hypothetical protein
VPTISRFYGIVIYMNYNDHDPPHFHARNQGSQVLVEINSGAVTGTMPKRALQLVFGMVERAQGRAVGGLELGAITSATTGNSADGLMRCVCCFK